MKNNFIRYGLLLFVLISMANSIDVANAQINNKVVVIPLGGDDFQDPTNGVRTLLFDANAIGGSAPANTTGLSFSNTFNGATCCGFLILKRPLDWDGTSNITATLFTQGIATGTDSFFVRPRDFNDGDVNTDTVAIQSDVRDFTSVAQFREFTVVLTAASLPKDWWMLVIQRATSSGTNTGDITLLSMEFSYMALQRWHRSSCGRLRKICMVI